MKKQLHQNELEGHKFLLKHRRLLIQMKLMLIQNRLLSLKFLHGDVQYAVVLGALYNGVDKPPYANEDGDNNLRVFQSRSGHRLTFDDTDGEERVELILHNEEIRIIWDSANRTVGVYSGRDIIIETEETFSLKCTDFILEASENIDIQSGVSTNLTSGVETAVDGGGEMTLQASMLTIN